MKTSAPGSVWPDLLADGIGGGVVEVGEAIVPLGGGSLPLIAQTQVEGKGGGRFPVILRIEAVVVLADGGVEGVGGGGVIRRAEEERGKAVAGLGGGGGGVGAGGEAGVEVEGGVGQAVAIVLEDGTHEAEGEIVPAFGLGEVNGEAADVAETGAFGALGGAEGGLAGDVQDWEDGRVAAERRGQADGAVVKGVALDDAAFRPAAEAGGGAHGEGGGEDVAAAENEAEAIIGARIARAGNGVGTEEGGGVGLHLALLGPAAENAGGVRDVFVDADEVFVGGGGRGGGGGEVIGDAVVDGVGIEAGELGADGVDAGAVGMMLPEKGSRTKPVPVAMRPVEGST